MAQHDYDELSMEHHTLSQQIKDLEQQSTAVPYHHSLVRRHSPSQAGMQTGTPYKHPVLQHLSQPPGCCPPAQASIILEPDLEGNTIMASLPTTIRPALMHPMLSQYNNPCNCNHSEYLWMSENGSETVGLPKT